MKRQQDSRWNRQPVIAGVLRTLIFVAPIAMAIGAVNLAGRVVTRPAALLPSLGWWVGLALVSTTVLWIADRATRRLLPVVALFKVSLVFPDNAPSRFKTALRSGTVRQLQRQLEAGELGNLTTQEAAEQLIALAQNLNAHDRQTRGHTERVRAYSAMIGEEMGLDQADLEFLNWSGLVHDIGKLAVPSAILNKPGKPTAAEWEILKGHPAEADRLIEPLRPWLGRWADSATQHHERFDGAGYPHGISGRDISLAGRIVAVADAYDVMTSVRSYKTAMSAQEAREELARCAGSQFDPQIVRAFLNVAIGRLRLVMGPLSSLVKLPAGGASLGSAAVSGVSVLSAVLGSLILGAIPSAPESLPDPIAFTEMADASAVTPGGLDLTLTGLEDNRIFVTLGEDLHEFPQSVRILAPPVLGSIEAVDTTHFVFSPEPDVFGTDSLTYEVCFPDGSCDEGTLTLIISPVGDAPEPADDTIVIAEDETEVIDPTANDIDVDGDLLEITSISVDWPDHDTTDLDTYVTAEGLIIAPAADQWGEATIVYEVTGPDGLSARASIAVDVTSVNDDPVARTDQATTRDGQTVVIDVLANDTDVDEADVITVDSVGPSSDGTAQLSAGTIHFTPNAGYSGLTAFSYSVSDGHGGSSTAAVEVTVLPTTGPLLVADRVSTLEDTAVMIDVLSNDAAGAAVINPATLKIENRPATGTATTAAGKVLFTPKADSSGPVSFTYSVCDNAGRCGTATLVDVSVSAVNDAPSFIAGADQVVVEDSGAASVGGWATSISAGPADEVGQTVVFSALTANPTLFVGQPAISASGALSFAPAPNASGSTSVVIVAADSGGSVAGGNNASATHSLNITITPVNDAPVANNDSGIGFTTTEDTPFTTANVTTNDTDPDDPIDPTTVTITTQPTNATATNNGDGTFNITPNLNWSGTDTLTYTIADPTNLTSTPATVTITITPVNDAPSVTNPGTQNSIVGEAFSLAIAASDVEPGTLSYGATGLPTGLSINTSGIIAGTPGIGTDGTHSVSVTVTDDGEPGRSTTVTFNIVVHLYAASAKAGSIVINEVLYVGTAIPTEEFVELFNAGVGPVDLTGWTLADSNLLVDGPEDVNYTIGAADHWGNPSVLQPGEFAVIWLAYNGATLPPVTNPASGLEYVILNDGASQLSNTGDSLWLLETPSLIVDYMAYGFGDGDPAPPAGLSLWDASSQLSLFSGSGQSLALSPNGVDGNTSKCWEPTGSGAAAPRCPGAPVTIDSDGLPALQTSVAGNNNTVVFGAGMVISEFSNVGGYQGGDFIELYNTSAAPIDVSGWTVETAGDTAITQTIPLTGPATVIPSGGHYLLAQAGATGADQTFASALTDSLSIRVRDGATIIDLVGTRERNNSPHIWPSIWQDGVGVPPLVDIANYTQSWERSQGSGYGNCLDTDDNSADFRRNLTAGQVNPQSSADPVVPCSTPSAPVAPTHLVISEYRTDGPDGGSDEFVEIFNPTTGPISLSGYETRRAGGGSAFALPGVVLAPGAHFLVAGASYAGASDAVYGGHTNGEGIELYNTATSSVVDLVVIGTSPPDLPKLDGQVEQSYSRRFDGCQDTDVWLDDFTTVGNPTPMTSTDPATPCP